MDAREHGVAQAKWTEFVNIEGGHSLTRQVGIHTGEQRMPADDVSGITVLVCSTEGANERWPIGRSSVEPLVSALDEMGITSGEARRRARRPRRGGGRRSRRHAGECSVMYRYILRESC